MKITPYYALSIVEKYVYENIDSLLIKKCPTIYNSYRKLLDNDKNSLVIASNSDFLIYKRPKNYEGTEIYKISRIIKGMQFTIKYNVIKIWIDQICESSSEEIGKQIFENLLIQSN